MRHAKAHRKFSRTPAHRKAMFRNMVTELFRREKIETTVHKAKDLRSVAERLITTGKVDNVHRRRKAYGFIQDKTIVHKLFAEIGPRFKERPGGYTRITRTRTRVGDAAEMAVIQFVDEAFKAGKSKKKVKKKSATKSAAAKTKVKAKEASEVVEVKEEKVASEKTEEAKS